MTRKTQKKLRKLLTLVCCAVMLVCVTVGATVAYLTSTASVTNTFTVGNVQIKLDETDVDENGVATNEGRKEEGNEYKLLPGHTYTKDPMVTVKKGTEESYIRMVVTVEGIDKLKAAFTADEYYANGVFLLENLVNGWDANTWISTDATADGTYEFTYNDTVSALDADVALDALFDSITIPGTIDNTTLANLNGVKVNVTAYAVQKDGFDTADAAFTAAWPTIFPAA